MITPIEHLLGRIQQACDQVDADLDRIMQRIDERQAELREILDDRCGMLSDLEHHDPFGSLKTE